MDNNLTIDFNPTAKLEICIRENRWCEVTADVFRSWSGGRKINGSDYTGPLYFYLSNEVSRKAAVETTAAA